jgi:ankyrin repeat protein
MRDWTPLSGAARQGHVEFAQMLLERGAVIDGRDNRGRTSLHTAVFEGNIEVVRFLLEHSVDVNARNRLGKNPSQYTTHISKTHKILEHALGYLTALERLFKYRQARLIVLGEIHQNLSLTPLEYI